MAAEAAALLDQLMGGSRNCLPGEESHQQSWKDGNVCKFFLCGFCPSQLFTNTKADVGPCYKVHDEQLRRSYVESDMRGKLGYEADFLAYLERIIRDLDRKITRGQDRLRRSAEAKQQGFSAAVGEGGPNEKLAQLTKDIDTKVTELEQLGADGRVEEAQELMKIVEQLEKERERERLKLTGGEPKMLAGFELDTHDFHEKMELCDVCGSFLVIGDSQCRVDAHLLGKQHMGYARIRSTITELRQQQEQQVKEKEAERQKRLEERKAQSESNEKQRRRSYRRSRSRDRHREKRSRSRGRDRSRSRGRDRSRSRGRDRSRSRGKDRSRSRGRDRSRSKGRGRNRSRSRGRKRSHSRGRDRSRSRGRDRSRSRGRKRSRSHGRKRSRSRGRKRSRSKDRGRSRSRERSNSRGRKKRRDSKIQERKSRSRSKSRERKKNAS